MPKIDDMLTRAKVGSEDTGEQSQERKLVESTEQADIFETSDSEVYTYSNKKNSREKLAAALMDGDVKQVQVRSGKPAVINHSKYGAMLADFEVSPTAAAKTLKTLELPLLTSTCKGDGGTIMSIEKIRENTSVVDLVNADALSSEAAGFLWTAISGKVKRCNVIIVGSGAERVELTNALSALIPSSEQVAVLNVDAHGVHWSSLDVPIAQGVKSASEMKFDWFVGELDVKKPNLLNYFHSGMKGILTMHGNTCGEVVQFLKATTSGRTVNCIDVVIAVHSVNGALKVTEISEVINCHAKPLYAEEKGKLIRVRLESELEKQAVYRGLSLKTVQHELAEKQAKIEELNKNGTRSNKEIRREINA